MLVSKRSMTRPPRSPVPVERVSGVSPEEFERQYRRCGRPVVLTDGISDWPAVNSWTFDSLQENVGSHPVTAVHAGEGAYAEVLERLDPRQMTLARFLDMIQRQPDCLLYLVESKLLDQVPALQRDVPRPRHAPIDRALSRRLWLGPAGTVTSFHQDGAGDFLSICTFFCQIRGRKRALLVSPDQSELMYPVARVDGATRKASAVDFDAPDLSRFPRFAELVMLEAVVGPGEVLFIPESWWHYLRALEPSISLSIDWIENPMGDLVSSMMQATDPVDFARGRAGAITLDAAREFPGGLPTVARALAQLPEDVQSLILILADEPLREALRARSPS